MSVKVEDTNIQNIVGQLEDKWKNLADGQPFSYTFLSMLNLWMTMTKMKLIPYPSLPEFLLFFYHC